MKITKWFAAATAAALLVTSLVTATPARAEYAKDIRLYRVAFTNGHGLRLRTGPSTSAPGYGDGNYILPDGAWFSGECEAIGDMVTNPYGESTDVWMRTPGGYFVSEAFLNTGTNISVGLPLCVELDFEARQVTTRKAITNFTVADYHRAGWPSIAVINSEKTSGRFYYSKAETKRLAAEFDKLESVNGFAQGAGNVVCAVLGAGLGFMFPEGRIVLAAVAGFGFDIGCGLASGAGTKAPDILEQARGAANAAAAGGRCFETRAHRDSADQEWTVDVFTATDSAGYCG